jgi:protein-tyrosine phosphatase
MDKTERFSHLIELIAKNIKPTIIAQTKEIIYYLATSAKYNTDGIYYNNPIDHITGNIYISDLASALNPFILQKYGIKKILSLELLNCGQELNKLCENYKITHKSIPIVDGYYNKINILRNLFEECHNFIKGDENILIHCYQGVSRSAAVLIYHLLHLNIGNFSVFDFIKYLRTKRNICPNRYFIKFLVAEKYCLQGPDVGSFDLKKFLD